MLGVPGQAPGRQTAVGQHGDEGQARPRSPAPGEVQREPDDAAGRSGREEQEEDAAQAFGEEAPQDRLEELDQATQPAHRVYPGRRVAQELVEHEPQG